MVAVFDSPGNFWSWAVWVQFSLSLVAVLGLDFQALRKIIAEAHNENLVDEPSMTKVSKKSVQTGSDSSNSMHDLRNRSRL